MHFTSCLFIVISPLLYQSVFASPFTSPQCYDDDGVYPAPTALDCIGAMGNLLEDKSYNTQETYGIYEAGTRKVPLNWSHKSCLVTIDVDDGSNTDTFALSSTMPAFTLVEHNCILKKKMGQGFGGYMPIGNGKTFYAIVQYNPSYQTSSANSRFLMSVNATNTTSNGTA